MFKALLKKDFRRLLASFTTPKGKRGKKGNNSQGKGGLIAMLCLWVFVFISIAMAFAGMDHMTGAFLIPLDFDWLYYSIASMMGIVVAIVANGFVADAVLYNAKDNDLLLAMPIPTKLILLSRMAELFALGLIYSVVIIVPAFVVRCALRGSFDSNNLIYCLVMILLIAVFLTAVSAVIGWIFAAIGKRVKNKSVFTLVFSVLFMGIYYYFNFNSKKYLTMLVENSLGIGEKIESLIVAFPVLHTGLALSGSLKSLLICIVMTAAFAGIVYYVLTVTFINVATASNKTIDVKYDAKEQENIKVGSPYKAVLKKEFGRFTSSATYMMNCGMGILFMLAASVVLVIKKTDLLSAINRLYVVNSDNPIAKHIYTDLLPVGIVFAVMMFASMCDIAAPSISLEGKNIWILQSMPIDSGVIFRAKQNVQLYITAPVAIVFMVVVKFVFGIEYEAFLYSLICSLMYIRLHASIGVMANLLFPKLDWLNEVSPIKNSLPVAISMLGSWILSMAIAAIYVFLLLEKVSGTTFVIILLVIFALAVRFIDKWLRTKGSMIFENL